MTQINSTFTRGWKAILVFAIVFTLVGLGMSSVQAQPDLRGQIKPLLKSTPSPVVDGGELVADEAQTGDITSSQYIVAYTYNGTKDDEITITMEATDGLEPLIAVIAPKASKASQQAKAAKNKTATLTMTLPSTGKFAVVASRVGVETGKSTGSFTITLTVSGSGGGGDNGGGGNGGGSGDVDLSQYPAQIDVSSNKPLDVINQLRDGGVVPKGGQAVLTVPRSVIEVRQLKFSSVPLGGGIKVQDFVLFFRLRFDEYGNVENNQCGMGFRVSKNGYSIVGLSNTKNLVLRQLDGQDTVIDVDTPIEADGFSVATDMINTFTVVALDDVVLVYLNGSLVAGNHATATSGVFVTFVYNQEGNEEPTGCAYSNIWVWGYK